MGKPQPGVRRLCIAAVTGPTGLLTQACRSSDMGRLCVTTDARNGTEMAFAPPGIDEVAVVTDLITGLRRLTTTEPGVPCPAVMAFHVGITRIEGDELGGAAALRTRALLLDPAIRALATVGWRLTVVMSAGLYADLRAEGIPRQGWRPVPVAGAWIRRYEISQVPEPMERTWT